MGVGASVVIFQITRYDWLSVCSGESHVLRYECESGRLNARSIIGAQGVVLLFLMLTTLHYPFVCGDRWRLRLIPH